MRVTRARAVRARTSTHAGRTVRVAGVGRAAHAVQGVSAASQGLSSSSSNTWESGRYLQPLHAMQAYLPPCARCSVYSDRRSRARGRPSPGFDRAAFHGQRRSCESASVQFRRTNKPWWTSRQARRLASSRPGPQSLSAARRASNVRGRRDVPETQFTVRCTVRFLKLRTVGWTFKFDGALACADVLTSHAAPRLPGPTNCAPLSIWRGTNQNVLCWLGTTGPPPSIFMCPPVQP
jgi:hypothetical protein